MHDGHHQYVENQSACPSLRTTCVPKLVSFTIKAWFGPSKPNTKVVCLKGQQSLSLNHQSCNRK